ncbi:transcriptional repressor LexA [Fodinibius halophilus]|uniref:Repressor LexA n=1 Tax=Fodinibius halophilus TaxID=1736908 RepID=A0A6M1TBA1_9BACT|nr:transcriptional repressor LexA [Fodinibius halophilus]NGP87582.1 repressor LexA [Fodinibius halophilus]
MEDLTPKQQQFYQSLVSFFQKHLRLPSHREAAELNGFKSANSSVQYHQALVDKGYLKKDGSENYTFTSPLDVWPGNTPSSSSIPVLGEITAGAMQEAIESDMGELTFEYLFPNTDNIFALRVKGMSMKNLDITDGDFVLLSKTEIRDGDVGAVLYNDETTLKRIYKENDSLRLEPANPEFEDIIIEPEEAEEVRILGKYVGHMNEQGIFKSPY